MTDAGEFDAFLAEQLQKNKVREAFENEVQTLRLAMKIQELRHARGFTQAELAEKIGTTQSVISRLENPTYLGHSLPVLQRVARALGKELVIEIR